jgi:hypothetical protein
VSFEEHYLVTGGSLMEHYESFLRSKNWIDNDMDSRYINVNHPYAILISDDEGQINLRGNTGFDNGQNGEEIFTFTSLKALQEWFENNIGE